MNGPALGRLLMAITAAVTLAVSMPANASSVFNEADVFVTEAPGQYTVTNNSANWYIFAFAVTNPLAGADLPGPTTTRKTWQASAEPCGSCGGIFDEPYFEYWTFISSEDVFENTVRNPFLIGPKSQSGQFFFTAPIASTYRIQLVNGEGDERQVFGTARLAVPEPGSWALMITGFSFLGAALRWRRAHTRLPQGT